MRTMFLASHNPRLLCILPVSSFPLVGCSKKPGRMEIYVAEGPNPWTHLNLHNNPDNFQFAIVSDKTGGGRTAHRAS